MYEFIVDLFWGNWNVLGMMAPYLLLGFFISGVFAVAIPPKFIERHLGGSGIWPVIKAALFGVPLPLCSCSVIPVSVSIRKHGASRAATTSFLLSTPQTGVDSIAVTYALMGPFLAFFRPVAALITGIAGGAVVRVFGRDNNNDIADRSASYRCDGERCSHEHTNNIVVRVLRYGFVTIPQDIGAVLLIGIVIAGMITIIIPEDAFAGYLGGGAFSVLLMMAMGVPLHVCATASVPIAIGAMHMGASPGAAVAFLIAGPATNAVSFATMWKVLGSRIALLYLATVAVSAFVSGMIIDIFFSHREWLQIDDYGQNVDQWYFHVAAVVLIIIIAGSYVMKRLHKVK